MTYGVSAAFGVGVYMDTATATELVSNVNAFDNASWTKTNTTIVANAVGNPVDGALEGDKSTENSSAGYHEAYSSVTMTTALTYRAKVYVKAGTATKVALKLDWTTTDALLKADLTLKSIISTSGSLTDAYVEDVGNGWLMLCFKITPTSPSAATFRVQMLDASGDQSYTGGGTAYLYMWGASLQLCTMSQILGVHNGPTNPGMTTRMIEGARHESSSLIRKPTFRELQAISFDIYYDSSDTVHLAVIAACKAKSRKGFAVVITDQGAEKYEFDGYISNAAFKGEVEGFNVYSITLEIDSELHLI